MGVRRSDITEFYYQLSVLARAGIPLPESLGRISDALPGPSWRPILDDLATHVGHGHPLSSALGRHPRLFDPFHVQLIASGEETDALPELLDTVARLARVQQQLTARLQAAIAYPLLIAHTACIAGLLFAFFAAPGLSGLLTTIAGINGREALPGLAAVSLGLMSWMGAHAVTLLVLYLLFLAGTLWVLSPLPGRSRVFGFIIDCLPGSWRISRSLDACRIATMWGLFLQRGIPFTDASAQVARLAERRGTMVALDRVTERVRQGEAPADALASESQIDPLIRLTFRHTPEDSIARELVRLGTLFVFDRRVDDAIIISEGLWVALATILISFVVGGLVMGFFLPLIGLVQNLSG